MSPDTDVEHLRNPLVTADQLSRFHDNTAYRYGLDTDQLLFAVAHLTQTAGVLLRLPQEVIATAIVLVQRSLVHGIADSNETCTPRTCSAAAVYLAAKQSFTPLSPRSVVNVYAYLTSSASTLLFVNPQGAGREATPKDYYVSEGTYEKEKQELFVCESRILASVGFDSQVALPHTLALTYLQALGVPTSQLARQVFSHLNGALVSPQMLYLTHQPNALAVAAIYLAAREVGVKLVEENWWEVFDADREDLGFLVLAMGSIGNFAEHAVQKWKERTINLG